MKKVPVLVGNSLIILTILALTFFYVRGERLRSLSAKTTAFENMTVAMENVTTNYLNGEEQVCKSWANHINANQMTMEEAITFVRGSIAHRMSWHIF